MYKFLIFVYQAAVSVKFYQVFCLSSNFIDFVYQAFTIKQLALTAFLFSFSHILVGDKLICAAASSPDTSTIIWKSMLEQ